MRSKKLPSENRVLLVIFCTALFAAGTCSAAQQEKVLHSFDANGKDGYDPESGLIFDAVGNLYGTTYEGGDGAGCSPYCGTVFELSPKSGGVWTEQVLHNFTGSSDGLGGFSPEAGLVLDASGNLYGTTYSGGAHGVGTVFELSPKTGGGWAEKVLYSFCSQSDCMDGSYPHAALIFDGSGNLYGTTHLGGTGHSCSINYGCGTVFELSPNASGGWTHRVLHSFNNNGADGTLPGSDGLIFDVAGNLYGATYWGGSGTCIGAPGGCGTVFELTPTAGGVWAETILHSFLYNGADGNFPSQPTFDSDRNLYGTTYGGGTYGYGTVFELTPAADGRWTETILHSFNDDGNDGYNPYTGLILDSSVNLYGTTYAGGTYNDGSVFELSPADGGGWTETVLHSFDPNEKDGADPVTPLVFDASGNLYGTTYYGGAAYNSYGTIFEIKH